MSYTSVFEGQTEAQQLATRMLVDFHQRTGIPAREGNVETALIEVAAHAHADTRLVVNDLADQAMMAMAGFLGIARRQATPAAADIQVGGEQGFVVPAGSLFAAKDQTVWELVDDITISDGVAIGFGRAVATTPGPVGPNSLGVAEQIGPLAGLDRAELTQLVADGTDQEAVGEYLDRAAREAQIMSIVPRLPEEFARVAMRHPKVAKAMAVNLLDGDGNADQAGHISVFVGNSQGTEMDSQTITAIQGLLNGDTARPLGVRVHVKQPTRKTFTVAVNVAGHGEHTDSVQREIEQRLAAYFAPATWDWMTSGVDHYDVAAVIHGVPWLLGIDSITFDGSRNYVALAEVNRPTIPVASVNVGVRG